MNEMHNKVAPLRDEIEFHPIEEDGQSMVLLRDPLGYAAEMLAFPIEALALMAYLDGESSIDDIRRGVAKAVHGTVDPAQIRAVVDALDEHLFLDSPAFHAARRRRDNDWLLSDTRPAAHAGSSYPADAAALRSMLEALFAADDAAPLPGVTAGVIAPHIDLGIGPQVYVPAFRQLMAAEFDTVVILGTSHYSGEDLFILTGKDYETPLGRARTDRDFLAALREASGDLFTHNDTAHRPEHSIEFPVLFLQHLFGADVRILPVLCTSFEAFLAGGVHAGSSDRYAAFLRGFRDAQQRTGRRCTFVLSVDWSHVGRKFGDEEDAAALLEDVRRSDHAHFEALARCDYDRFHELLQTTQNGTRIDGFSCITTFFNLARPVRGALLRYEQWHEEERASAVSFASMAFFHEEGTSA
jgi:MEMO1 family protein